LSTLLTARFDIINTLQVDMDQWIFEGAIVDSTGQFFEPNIEVDDIIYQDQSFMGFGVGRYKVLSIDPETTFGLLKVIAQWDITEDSYLEPLSYVTAIIGQADDNGATAVASFSSLGIDEAFISAVRNIENMRISKRVSIATNIANAISVSKESKLGNPLKDLSYLTSNKAGQRTWKFIDPIDRIEKGAFGGLATLDMNGKIPQQQIPSISIIDVLSAGNETEMLALNAQKGDICLRSDTKTSYILKSEPALVLDNWAQLGGQSSGGTGGTSTVSNETRKIQSYRLFASYSIGEMVLYDNLLWIAKRGLFTVGEFDKNEWILVAGNMSSYSFDADGDGIIDRANWADGSKYAMISDESRMIQSWKPNTQYAVGEQVTYANEFWTVKAHFTSGVSFSDEYLEPLSLKKHSVLLELQGGNSATSEFYHLTAPQHEYLTTKFSDNNNQLVYNGKLVGDMMMSTYDPNGDGVVISAETLSGLISSVAELNNTKGTKSNIQTQLDTLKLGMTIKGSVATYADLNAIAVKVPGDSYVVTADETQLDGLGNPQKTLYIYQGTAWAFLCTFTIIVRDFAINPINILTESIGTLPANRIDSLIARKTDLHTHPNKGLVDSYTFANSQVLDLIGTNHNHANKSLIDTYTITNTEIADAAAKKHSHMNLTLLEKFSIDVDGKLLYNNALIEGTGGGGGGTGITDLNSFTTSDLIDNTDKRYVTDAQLLNIKTIPTLASTQLADEAKINDIITKIPGTASYSNKLATMADLAGKVGVTNFKSLTDVNPTFVPNAFVVVNTSGSGLTYLNKIDMKIQKIIDMDGNIFTNVPSLSFKELDASLLGDGTIELTIPKLKALQTTDLLDMPKVFETGKILISNASTMKYELKGIGDITNSKANFASEINPGDWTFNSSDMRQEKIVEHALNSTNLIVSFYDVNGTVVPMSYRILDTNQIMAYSTVDEYRKVVINCSQGTVGDGSGGSGSGGSVAITASTFIDDTRLRLDKTFSSQHINDVLVAYPKKATVYTRAEADAVFAVQANEHVHANKTVLDKLTVDELGNPVFNSKPLLTSVNAATYQQHWTGQDETAALKTIVDTFVIYQAQNFASILNAEFTVKNLIPSVDATTDNKPENQLRLVITDGAITLMDVNIPPLSVQKYILGISPNIKILIQGNFDANYYVGAF
jgi:hypothetical protein